MKNLFFTLFLMFVVIKNPISTRYTAEIAQVEKGDLARWVEWVCDTTGQWYIIIHEDDGSIKSYPVAGQGVD